MPRPRLPDETIRKIEEEWGRDPKMTAKDVHSAVRRKYGEIASLRFVQDIVRGLKNHGAGEFVPEEWRAWQNGDESPQDTHALLTLKVLTRLELKRPLYQHEAKWATRLRPALRDAPFWLKMEIVGLFAERESVSRNLGREPFTADLDYLVTFRPWESRRQFQRYHDTVYDEPTLVPAILQVIEFEGRPPVVFTGVDALLMKLVTANQRFMSQEGQHPAARTLQITIHSWPDTAYYHFLNEQRWQSMLNILFDDDNELNEEDQHERIDQTPEQE